MAVTEQKQNLITLLTTTAQLDDILTKHITDVIGCSSIADFASIYTKADYEEKIVTELLDKTTLKDNILQRGRLRAAWKLANAQFTAAAGRV